MNPRPEPDYRAPVRVMEPVSHPEAFDDPGFLGQVKWDGVRIVAFVAGAVRLQNRRLFDRTAQYPELSPLAAATRGHRAILDGEVVVLQQGKPSFPGVLRRDLAKDARAAGQLARVLPVGYNVFDLLALDAEDLRQSPLEDLLQRLGDLLEPGEAWQVVESFPGHGRELFAAVQRMGLEGVVLKERRSPYTAGKRTRAWLKVKSFRVESFVLGGVAYRGSQPASLLLGRYRNDRLWYVGRVGSGLAGSTLQNLEQVARELGTRDCPFANRGALPGRGVLYLRPALTGLVRYLEWTENLQLRAPSWQGFSRAAPEECRLE